MLENPRPQALQQGINEFVSFRRAHLRGDEKGEAQVFLDRLFKALGHDGAFEAGATLEMRVKRHDNGGTAFADLVWKPRVLIEMKKAGEDLQRHYRQAFEYWIDLVPDRPQYVVLCNFDELWIYDLNMQLEEPVDRVTLDELSHRWEAIGFMLPVEERPDFRNDLVEVTRESAATVARVFNHLLTRDVERSRAQRFALQCVMAMFAEDIGLLPSHMFSRAIEDCIEGASAYDLIFGLFREMDSPGITPAGRFAGTPYFNGGLFGVLSPLDLTVEELHALYTASREDWRAVRPEIFGTLFEQSLEREERHAYGAHFTSEIDIQKIVLPTIVRPWRQRITSATTILELNEVADDMLRFRVLDPACGCGNFLYVAYRELRRLEHSLLEKISGRRRRRGAQTQLAFVSPTQFFGLDINAFAVEIAKVTLMVGRKLAADELGDERTVLPLDDLDRNIVATDALRTPWPPFDACIGNPPYLGRRRLIEERGADYAAWLGNAYPDVRGVSDYVVYWFRLAHDRLPKGGRAGLVGTNSVREGDTRVASLDYIVDNGGQIYEAVSTQPWSGDAQVNVSIVNWIKGPTSEPKTLWLADGQLKVEVDEITSSLSTAIDLRRAEPLAVNREPKRCFQGQTPGHVAGFVIDAAEAERLAIADTEDSVVHPFFTGDELNGVGYPTRFIIDFPDGEAVHARNRAPAAFERIRHMVLPDRRGRADQEAEQNTQALEANPKARVNWHHRNFLERWWQLSYRRPDLLDALRPLSRYIALSRYAIQDRMSIYAFVSTSIRPSDKIQVFAFDDDYSFGILQSAVHRAWFEARCTTLGQALSYTSKTVFETFPWPQAPTAAQVQRVVDVVESILTVRDSQTRFGISIGEQYDSLRDPGASALRNHHDALDAAVMDAYGFDDQDDLLVQLLALNLAVADEIEHGLDVRAPGNAGLDGTHRTTTRITPTALASGRGR